MIASEQLKARTKEMGLTQKEIADAMGVSQAAVSQKFSGVRPMTLDEAEKLCTILQIGDAEIGRYFFAKEIA